MFGDYQNAALWLVDFEISLQSNHSVALQVFVEWKFEIVCINLKASEMWYFCFNKLSMFCIFKLLLFGTFETKKFCIYAYLCMWRKLFANNFMNKDIVQYVYILKGPNNYTINFLPSVACL